MEQIQQTTVLMTVIIGLMAIVKATPQIPNWWIPFLAIATGVVATGLWAGWTGTNIILGIQSGMLAVGGHQVLQQGTTGRTDHAIEVQLEKRTPTDMPPTPPPQQRIPAILLCAGLLATASGCAVLEPGADPVVVRAEQAAEMSFATVDSFLLLEFTHRDQLGGMKAAADYVRENYPPALKALRAATQTYKAVRNTENRDALTTALAVVNLLTEQAREWLIHSTESTKP